MSTISDAVECDFLKYPIQTQGEFKYNGANEFDNCSDPRFQPNRNMSCEHGVSHDQPLVSNNNENETPSLMTQTLSKISDKNGNSDHGTEISDSNYSGCAVYSEDNYSEASENNSSLHSENNSSLHSENNSVVDSENNYSVTSEENRTVEFSTEGSTQLRSRKPLTAEEKREKHRLDQQQRRRNELPWEKTKRLQRSAERQRLKRLNFTDAEKQRAKELAKKRTKERRARETDEQKEIRRIRDRIRMREKRALIKQVRVLGAEVVAQSCVRLLNPATESTSLLQTTVSSPSAAVDLSNIVLTADPSLLPDSTSHCVPPTADLSDLSCSILETPVANQSPQPCPVTQGDNSSSGTIDTSHDTVAASTTALYAVAKDYLATEHEKYLKQKEKQRLRCRERRANESAEEHAVRLRKAAERQRLKRMSLTEQEKVLYNEVNRLRARKRRSEESPQQQENRRSSERVRRREQRALARQVQEVGAGPPTFVNGLNHSDSGCDSLPGDFGNRGFADSELILS